jgi:hypothetical protein
MRSGTKITVTRTPMSGKSIIMTALPTTTPNGDGETTNYHFREEVEIPLDFSTGGLFHQRTFSWDQPA